MAAAASRAKRNANIVLFSPVKCERSVTEVAYDSSRHIPDSRAGTWVVETA